MTDCCHQAYADQLEQTIRELGSATTTSLVKVMHPTPALVDLAERHRAAGDTVEPRMHYRWLTPYLRLLVQSDRVVLNNLSQWVPCPPVIVHDLTDPLSDREDGEQTNHPGGLSG